MTCSNISTYIKYLFYLIKFILTTVTDTGTLLVTFMKPSHHLSVASHHDRVMARLAGYWYIVGMISSFVIWARLVTRIQHRASPAQHTTATHHSSLWKYNLYRICSPCCPYIWWPVSPSLVTAHYSSSQPQPRILKFVCTGILQHKPVTSSYFPAAQTRWQVHFRC